MRAKRAEKFFKLKLSRAKRAEIFWKILHFSPKFYIYCQIIYFLSRRGQIIYFQLFQGQNIYFQKVPAPPPLRIKWSSPYWLLCKNSQIKILDLIQSFDKSPSTYIYVIKSKATTHKRPKKCDYPRIVDRLKTVRWSKYNHPTHAVYTCRHNLPTPCNSCVKNMTNHSISSNIIAIRCLKWGRGCYKTNGKII